MEGGVFIQGQRFAPKFGNNCEGIAAGPDEHCNIEARSKILPERQIEMRLGASMGVLYLLSLTSAMMVTVDPDMSVQAQGLAFPKE